MDKIRGHRLETNVIEDACLIDKEEFNQTMENLINSIEPFKRNESKRPDRLNNKGECK